MNRDLCVAVCASAALHIGLVGFCPAPRASDVGMKGTAREITVLGVIRPAASPVVKPAPMELASQAKVPQCTGMEKPLQPEREGNLVFETEEATAWVEAKLTQVRKLWDTVNSQVALHSVGRSLDRTGAARQARRASAVEEHPARNQDSEETVADSPHEETASSPASRPAEVLSLGDPGDPGAEDLSYGETGAVRSRYLAGVMRKLQEAKRYPKRARRHGIEGDADVEFTILADGRACEATVFRSSGRRVLDDAVQAMIQRASPFRPIPAELNVPELRISVPIAFRLENRR